MKERVNTLGGHRLFFYDSPFEEERECPVDAALIAEGVKRGMTHEG